MRVLVVAPTEREYRNISATIAGSQALRHSYNVICSGIGKAAAAATTAVALAQAEQPYDMVAVVGFAAGSLGFRQGEVVCPSTTRYHDCDVPEGFIPELTDPLALAGTEEVTVFTGDSFINARTAAEIKGRFGVERAIYDMEITAIKIAAQLFGNLPVMAVKFISDVPEDGDTEHSYDAFADAHSDFSPLLAKVEALG